MKEEIAIFDNYTNKKEIQYIDESNDNLSLFEKPENEIEYKKDRSIANESNDNSVEYHESAIHLI